jgi:hypothetical protein
MIANEKEFDDSLKQLGDLYEEGKTCLHLLIIRKEEQGYYYRLFDILKEMRDLSAVNMQKLHFKIEN